MLGHRRDPVHPFSDAGMLVEEMPNARLIEADSLLELRLQPERLTNEIADFLDELWAARAPAAPSARRRKPASVARQSGQSARQTPRQTRARQLRLSWPRGAASGRLVISCRGEQFELVDAHVARAPAPCRRPRPAPG